MKYLIPLFCSILLFLSCVENKEVKTHNQKLTAQTIIDKAINLSCQGNCDQATIEFKFRDRIYKSKRNNGDYLLERFKTDSLDVVHDMLSNSDLKRFINDSLVTVPDSLIVNISDGVNSVHYFAQLPYGLNSTAVHKKLLGEDNINGKNYYEIEVTFSEKGGGTDFDDRFVYWIHKENFTVDFLAYRYATNGGGMRFREAYNERTIEGIRFVDYNNYKPESLEHKLEDLDNLFENGKLKLLSKIETEDVKVDVL